HTRSSLHRKLQLPHHAAPEPRLTGDIVILFRENARPYSSALSISATGIAPSLPILQVSPFNSTIVEASVAPVSPVSSTSGTRNPSCFITCSAFEHDGNPEMLALVPVIGPSNSSIRRRTTVLFGHRNPMRPVPAVTLSGMRCAAFTTTVSPPCHDACAS